MGAAIARRLRMHGYEVNVWNRDRARAESLGVGPVVDTPADLSVASDIVLSSLAGPAAVREVYLGHRGAAAGANGQTFIETSTIGPDAVIEISAALQRRRSDLLDAPILGVPSSVADGSSLVLVSGDESRSDAAHQLLECIGAVRYVGALGTASRLKLISNSMVATLNAEAAELLRLARSNGLDVTLAFDLLARQAPGLEVRREHYTTAGASTVVFSASGMQKDLDLALDLPGARSLLPLTSTVRRLVAELARADPMADLSAMTFSDPPMPS